MSKVYDSIILGTGVGGLSAGLSLAKRGNSVLLLEAGKQFGGMLNPFARKRYHFDVGIHYVGEAGEGQAMRRLLDSLGLEDIRFREINPDCIDRYAFGGYEAKLVKGIDRWGDLLCADFPREKENIRRFLELMKACRDLTKMFVRGPSFGAIASAVRHAPQLARLLHASFADVLADYFEDPVLRAVFAGPGGDIGVPPSRASALVSILVLVHFLAGAYYPIGGSGAMRDAYVEALEGHGAELMRNQLVTRIEVLGEHRFVVHTGRGLRLEARSVVSNVDVANTVEMIEGARPNLYTRRKVAKLRPSLGSFCLFVGTDLDLTTTGMTDANIWHYGTHDLESGYAAVYENRMADNPFFFLTAPTLKDPDTVRAPNGHHTVELITFTPTAPFKPWFDKPTMKRGDAYDAIKAETAQRMLEAAEQYIPGLRQHVVLQESATPATVWHFVRGREGGIYGPEHSPDQSFPRRAFTSIGIPGIYLAGASVLGAGVMTCMSSGVMAGAAAGKHLKRGRTARSYPWSRASAQAGVPT